jgi:NAD(P)H dehydrogenase (quinone)
LTGPAVQIDIGPDGGTGTGPRRVQILLPQLFDTFLEMLNSGRQNPAEGASARNLYGELGGKSNGSGDSFTVQHLKEVAIDHQNGVFEGTNDLVEKLGGRPPMTLEAFIEKHRAAFE